MQKIIDKPIISADSHITEPPDMYQGRVSTKDLERMPRLIRRDEGGEVFDVEGLEPFPITMCSAAGLKGEKLSQRLFENLADCHPGGWDSRRRLADQDVDGVSAEVLYPSLGMVLCNHPDIAYKTVCFDAYNAWLAEYCSVAPNRLVGLGQTPMASPKQGVRDLEAMKKLGLKGVMLPGYPEVEDYDSPIYDEFFAAAVELNMPCSFHILTFRDGIKWRGSRLNKFMNAVRGNQDTIGMLIFGGVFERHPGLKVVCAEADAGWAPHYMYRMNHSVAANPYKLGGTVLSKKPSEYFMENMYLTFQDDHVALQISFLMNPDRLMWASDFPHLDSTWPRSQQVLQEHAAHLTAENKDKLLHDNVAGLYGLAI